MNQSENIITLVNVSVADLYLQALTGNKKETFHRNRMIMDVNEMIRDCITTQNTEMKLKGSQDSEAWLRKHGYCYEQVTNTEQAPQRYHNMLRDLDGFFGRLYGITGKVEKRKTRCWLLIRTSKDAVIPAEGIPDCIDQPGFFKLTNMPLSRLIHSLNKKYMACSDVPVVDGTNYKGNVNIEIRACLHDMQAVNAALEKYNLRFMETLKDLDMVVIREKSK